MSYFENELLEAVLDSSKLVTFDMNGHIIDDEPLHFRACCDTLHDLGIALSEYVFIMHWVGRHVFENFERTLREEGRDPQNHDVGKLVREKNAIYRDLLTNEVHTLIRPGIRELLDYLSQSPSHRLALATSAMPEEVEAVLGQRGLNLLDVFDYNVNGGDIKHGKPHPETYLLISAKAGIDPSLCLTLEDAAPGVRSAITAGMKCFATPCDYTRHQNFQEATYVLSSLLPSADLIYNPKKGV